MVVLLVQGYSLQKPHDDGDCLVACLITRNNSELWEEIKLQKSKIKIKIEEQLLQIKNKILILSM